jgi:hypothetical protein
MNAGGFTPIVTGARILGDATEADVATPVRSLGTFSTLSVFAANASSTDGNWQFRIAAGNGNEIVSITALTTGQFTDATNTDAPTAGQTVDVQNNSFNGEASVITIVFAATSGTVGRIGIEGGLAFSFAGSTQFCQFNSQSGFSSTEANVQTQLPGACTLQNLAVFCATKGRSKADTVTLRNAVANGNSTVSVTGTGLFEDTSHTDSISANGKVDIAVTTGSGAGSDSFTVLSVEQSTGDGSFHVVAGNGAANTINQNPAFFGLGGNSQIFSSESQFKQTLALDATFSLLGANITANTTGATGTFTLRDTGANSSVVFTVSSGATGFFQDATHTDAAIVGDKLCHQITGLTSGAYTIPALVILATPPPAFSPDEDLWLPPAFMLSDPDITVFQ